MKTLILASARPTQPGYYVLRIASGGPHMVLVQQELDGTLTVHFDHPKTKVNGRTVSDHCFDDARWSEIVEIGK